MFQSTRSRRAWPVLLAFSLLASMLSITAASPAAAQPTPTTFANPGDLTIDIGQPMCVDLDVAGSGTLTVTPLSTLPVGITVGVPSPGEFVLQGTAVSTGTSEIRLRATGTGGTADVTFDLTRFRPLDTDPVIKAGRLETGFTIDCTSQGRAANQFLSDIGNFGPSGTVRLPRGLVVAPHTRYSPAIDGGARINAAYLADADILFDGWVASGAYSRGELALIQDFVEGGGVLVSSNDFDQADPLAELFGVPVAGWSPHCGDPEDPQPICPTVSPPSSARNNPIVNGPFGRWSRIRTDGTVGWFARNPAGWNVVAVNNRGFATVIERRVGNGHVILLSDEGLWRTELDGDNGRFLGNLMAFALDQISLVPEPDNDVLVGRLFRSFRADLCANDVAGDGRQRLRVVDGALPPGLRLNGCILSGTPALPAFGTHAFTYRLTDADGDSNTAQVQVTLTGEFDPNENNPRCQGRLANIVGTPGDDVFAGTSGNDVIVAGTGNDTIDGGGGNDIICGGRGNDTIAGGAGNDTLLGEAGRDGLSGGDGRDTCNGGPAKDTADRTCERRQRI